MDLSRAVRRTLVVILSGLAGLLGVSLIGTPASSAGVGGGSGDDYTPCPFCKEISKDSTTVMTRPGPGYEWTCREFRKSHTKPADWKPTRL